MLRSAGGNMVIVVEIGKEAIIGLRWMKKSQNSRVDQAKNSSSILGVIYSKLHRLGAAKGLMNEIRLDFTTVETISRIK